MREKIMQEVMQQDLAVPQKVHDGFEKGLRQIYDMDAEEERVKGIEAGMGETEQRKYRIFWRRAGLVAVAASAVFVIAFHSQIYSFAKSLFIHDTITMGGTKVQETDMSIVKINDGVLTDDFEGNYFESLEDLGEKLGVSFLKSSVANEVTGKGKVVARMYSKYGEVSASDSLFFVKDVSDIRYTEDGQAQCHLDGKDSYTISCSVYFHTKHFQDDFGMEYEDMEVIEEYETKNGFHAIIFGTSTGGAMSATLSHDNIRYEYDISGEPDEKGKVPCTIEEFKSFLDTLY